MNLSRSFLAYEIFVSAADSVLPHAERLEAPELTKRTPAASLLFLEHNNWSHGKSVYLQIVLSKAQALSFFKKYNSQNDFKL